MSDVDPAVKALRRFNRFHTRFTGVLDASFLGSGLSLTEARFLFEIATREPALAATVRAELGLDAGYLSRIVARCERRGWIRRGRGTDARQRPIELTPAGRAVFDALDRQTRAHVEAGIEGLGPADRERLIEALATVRRLLGDDVTDVSPASPAR
jgi:DNA-binding MarR family transcriptional regulator